ncbi:uncharacterized protein LOC116611688 isoform X3 [Nematostella vectensis]|uniref:uncharacterized protein LOC116611688 isoform X3 n=1 Tax=Nematostella vectensis TaxID=45351 RepID=UPI00207779D3|nr:uncharacterized protein LOC116611688 isoform X3 [Nematostella vectensis]
MEETEEKSSSDMSTKDWLRHADQSLSRLQGVKKNRYQLGGGPREREVNCQCNYRSKSKSSYLSMEAGPPQMSQYSQETASNSEISIPELLKHYNDKKLQKPPKKRRPYSATVHPVTDSPKQTTRPQGMKTAPSNKPFIAAKGSTLSLKPRPASGSSSTASGDNRLYRGCLLHLDPEHVINEQKATLEGLRKYSAFGQTGEYFSPTPPPPRASPEPPPDAEAPFDDDVTHHDDADGRDDDFDDDNDGGFSEGEESDDSFDLVTSSSISRPLVFEIPTADLDGGESGDETRVQPSAPRNSFEECQEAPEPEERALSADYVAKSDTFLQDLAIKQQQESAELTEMMNDMAFAEHRVQDIDLHSLMSSRMTTTTPRGNASSSQGESSGLKVVNIGQQILDPQGLEGEYEVTWVEDPYVPRVPTGPREFPERFHPPLRRVQSAKMSRDVKDGEFVLKGRNFEFLDAHDLSVTGRLGGSARHRSSESSPSYTPPKKAVPSRGHQTPKSNITPSSISTSEEHKIAGKPPRPKSSKRRTSKPTTHLPSSKQHDTVNDDTKPIPHPPSVRKSSLRKSFSQGDVRCLSPEVISSVKKTVSFSNEVLEKHTSKTLGVQRKCVDQNQESKENSSKLACSHAASDDDNPNKSPSNSALNMGVIIQNGEEVKGLEGNAQQSPSFSVPQAPAKTNDKKEGGLNVVAKLKEATRCSCHEEQCPCRDIIRPTMGVLCQAKAARERADDAGKTDVTKEKLLKQRLSRPSSAPIRRAQAERPRSPPSPTRSRITSAMHKRSGSEGARRPRPVSAHIRRPSSKETRRRVAQDDNRTRPGSGITSRSNFSMKAADLSSQDLGFVWGADDDGIAASEECEDVYNRFKEKGIAISMETVKRGLMPPARRASESCMTTLAFSTSSGLLSRPETWMPEEYARIKKWDRVLKKGR